MFLTIILIFVILEFSSLQENKSLRRSQLSLFNSTLWGFFSKGLTAEFPFLFWSSNGGGGSVTWRPNHLLLFIYLPTEGDEWLQSSPLLRLLRHPWLLRHPLRSSLLCILNIEWIKYIIFLNFVLYLIVLYHCTYIEKMYILFIYPYVIRFPCIILF